MGTAVGSDAYIAMIKQDPAIPLVMPATPVMQKVAFSKSDLGSEIETTESKNITGNRRLSGATLTGFTIGGGYEAEMTYGASLDDELMLAAIMCEAWVLNEAIDGKFYQPFFMEVGHTGVGQYFTYFGMVVDEWMMKYADQSLVESSFKFVGLQEAEGAAPAIGATYTDPTDNPVFSTVSNVQDIKIDGVASGECEVKEWDLTISNNTTGKTGVGVMGACSTNAHGFRGAGKITIYFQDVSMQTKLKAGTPFSFEWTVLDGDGNGYHFILPKCQLDTNKIPIEGVDSDIMNDASFVILDDSVTDAAMIIERTTAP